MPHLRSALLSCIIFQEVELWWWGTVRELYQLILVEFNSMIRWFSRNFRGGPRGREIVGPLGSQKYWLEQRRLNSATKFLPKGFWKQCKILSKLLVTLCGFICSHHLLFVLICRSEFSQNARSPRAVMRWPRGSCNGLGRCQAPKLPSIGTGTASPLGRTWPLWQVSSFTWWMLTSRRPDQTLYVSNISYFYHDLSLHSNIR